MPDTVNEAINSQRGLEDFKEFRQSISIADGTYTVGGYLLTIRDARKINHCKVNCRGSISITGPGSPSTTYSAHGEPVNGNQVRVKFYIGSGTAKKFAEASDTYDIKNIIIDVIAWGY
jgi:hypothetical protein